MFNLITTAALVVHLGGNPESAAFYGKQVLASNMGATQDSVEDGDGRISLISANGKLLEENFLPLPGDAVIDSPLGIAVSGDVVYVADVRRVLGFSLIDRKKVFESRIPVDSVEYLNDLVDIGNGKLFVTATNIKRSFIVDLKSGEWKEFMPSQEFRYVNGTAYDASTKTLYMADNRDNKLQDDNGRLMAFDLSGGTPQLLWESHFGRFIDGIAILGDGRLAITDWGSDQLGGVVHYLSAARGVKLLFQAFDGKGLADVDFQSSAGSYVFAAMVDGDVRLVLP